MGNGERQRTPPENGYMHIQIANDFAEGLVLRFVRLLATLYDPFQHDLREYTLNSLGICNRE
jgi:hypothetical protein